MDHGADVLHVVVEDMIALGDDVAQCRIGGAREVVRQSDYGTAKRVDVVPLVVEPDAAIDDVVRPRGSGGGVTCDGARARISSSDRWSFRETTISAPSSPRYCTRLKVNES